MSTLTVTAPEGATFEYGEVKTKAGEQTLGQVPLLVWNDLNAAREYYGDEGICDILNGTSLRVSFQSIARRGRTQNKSDDEIAQAQLKFRPGKKAVGVSTPVSRARKAADSAAQKLSNPDLLTALLAKIESGEISEDTLAGIAQ